ncbi:MAG: hypothetical protein ACLT14_00755 [Butyricicoccaceae bacterium]
MADTGCWLPAAVWRFLLRWPVADGQRGLPRRHLRVQGLLHVVYLMVLRHARK